MKKSFLIFLMIISSITMLAQTKKYYCEVKGIEKELSSGLKIVFDFGNNPVYSAWGGLKSKQQLVDEEGEEIPFNSMVHWIFCKEATNPNEAVKGIMTKDEYNKTKKKDRNSR